MSIGWQEELRQRLVDRNTRESAYSNIIEQCERLENSIPISPDGNHLDRRLAQQTRLLKERNQSLLRAVGSVRNAPGGGTNSTMGSSTTDEYVRVCDWRMAKTLTLDYFKQQPGAERIYRLIGVSDILSPG